MNSYADFSEIDIKTECAVEPTQNDGEENSDPYAVYAAGFKSIYKPKRSGAVTFAELLDRVARINPEVRIRFTSPHPKEFSDQVLEVIARHPNICKWVNMPA